MPRQPCSSSTSVALASDLNQISPSMHISEDLLNGGSNNMAVNGSITPVTFSYTSPAGFNFEAVRMMLYIEAQTAFSPDEFGDIATLANGVQINAAGSGVTNWKNNVDVVIEMYDFSRNAFGKSDKLLVTRWTFTRDTNGKTLLMLDGQSFDAVIQDDLSGLVIFRMKIKGVLIAA